MVAGLEQQALDLRLQLLEALVVEPHHRALWLVGVGIHEGALTAAHIDSSSLHLYLGLTLGAQRLVLAARGRGESADEALT